MITLNLPPPSARMPWPSFPPRALWLAANPGKSLARKFISVGAFSRRTCWAYVRIELICERQTKRPSWSISDWPPNQAQKRQIMLISGGLNLLHGALTLHRRMQDRVVWELPFLLKSAARGYGTGLHALEKSLFRATILPCHQITVTMGVLVAHSEA
jgi:hypothetical protein